MSKIRHSLCVNIVSRPRLRNACCMFFRRLRRRASSCRIALLVVISAMSTLGTKSPLLYSKIRQKRCVVGWSFPKCCHLHIKPLVYVASALSLYLVLKKLNDSCTCVNRTVPALHRPLLAKRQRKERRGKIKTRMMMKLDKVTARTPLM